MEPSNECDKGKASLVPAPDEHNCKVKASLAPKSDQHKHNVFYVLSIFLFQSIIQMKLLDQTEVSLIRSFHHNDAASTARALANTAGISGILGLFINDAGGKLSDHFGRKRMFLAGPLATAVTSALVSKAPDSQWLVLLGRVLRSVFTMFSGMVMTNVVFSDLYTSSDYSVALSKFMANASIAMAASPIAERVLLSLSKGRPEICYAAVSLLSLLQGLFIFFKLPETLDPKNRKTSALASSLSVNPLGFTKIFTNGTSELKRLVTATALMYSLDKINLKDVVQLWMQDHLHLNVSSILWYQTVQGASSAIAIVSATPLLLRSLSTNAFTALTTFANSVGLFMIGIAESRLLFIGSILPSLLGGNSSNTLALRSRSIELALVEGFGKGEFTAMTSNMRMLVNLVATVLYGNVFALCKKRGVFPGVTFLLAALVGGVLPTAMVLDMDKKIYHILKNGRKGSG